MCRSGTQAQLVLFLVNPPLMALSGSFTPIEAMHFAGLAREVMVKGAGLDVVYPSLFALTVLVGVRAITDRT